MPIYTDSSETVTVTAATDKGASILVRNLGMVKQSSLWKFVADIETDNDWDGKIVFWNDNFSVESGSISFAVAERKRISFEDWVFCADEDKFYVTIEITDFQGNATIDLTFHSSYLVRGLDSLMLNTNGNVLWNEQNYNSGILLDVIDGDFIRNENYDNLAQEYINRVVQAHVSVNNKNGVYPRAFIDGDFRVFNDLGDSMIITSFDHDDNIDVEDIEVVFVDEVDPTPDHIDVTTGLGSDSQTYTGPDFYDFQITATGDTEDITVWVDVEKSKDAGSIDIDDINTVVVKKYLEGSIDSEDGFETITRTQGWMSYRKPVQPSTFKEEITLSFVGPDYEADLSYNSTQDKDTCLLERDGIAIPNDLWDFVDADTIEVDAGEYDSTAVYEFTYKINQVIDFEIDLTPFSALNEMYLLPFIDWFSLRDSDIIEEEREESVIFDVNGVGQLTFFSNEDVGDTSVVRITGAVQETLPASALVGLNDDVIEINPIFVGTGDFFLVKYKARIGQVSRALTSVISWRYELSGGGWSSWVEWEDQTTVPWKYFNSGVLDIDTIQLRVEIDTETTLVYIRGAGLIVLSLREGELEIS